MSVRAFTDQPVDRGVIEQILQIASRAPSGTNCQPWRVYVLQRASRSSLVDKVCTVHDAMRSNPRWPANTLKNTTTTLKNG